MSTPNPSGLCPCGSQKNFALCCEPFLTSKACAPTAEALMRSRYCGFYSGHIDYLIATLHPSKREPDDSHNLKITCAKHDWLSLSIRDVEKGQPGDDRGTVEFIARYMVNQQLSQLHERSNFVRHDNRWYYLDGRLFEHNAQKTPKVGRNEPCWCGSSRKYKKCHGAT